MAIELLHYVMMLSDTISKVIFNHSGVLQYRERKRGIRSAENCHSGQFAIFHCEAYYNDGAFVIYLPTEKLRETQHVHLQVHYIYLIYQLTPFILNG